ncbi:hypothetical protein MRP92_05655 [Flavobacterium covae]|uniref:hypothetical protein n=1 Tax=Flavobacterium covae TaxID=2906076 RepID=UPI001FB59C60|nr:hypothetical protein [Flavobacterium covae]MCJ1806397.1 hypothetical protein [Flavobacterium covae]
MISYELRVAKVGFCGQTMLFFYNFEKNDAMDDKKKNKLEEPAEVYNTASRIHEESAEVNEFLLQMLEEAKQDIVNGKGITHNEVQERMKTKFSFLK